MLLFVICIIVWEKMVGRDAYQSVLGRWLFSIMQDSWKKDMHAESALRAYWKDEKPGN